VYFPYFRGRQYELLALRDLAQGGLLGSCVIPVVEPVKLTSTFSATVNMFTYKNHPFALILNTVIGELSRNIAVSKVMPSITGSIIPSVIMGKDTEDAITALSAKNISGNEVLTVMTNRDFLETYCDLFGCTQPKYTLFPDER
jgi:hypothetical protein